jgi:hypothetical protein
MTGEAEDPAADLSPNALERAMARAMEDAEHFPEFFRVLMESEVYVLGHGVGDTDEDAEAFIPPGGSVSIVGDTDPDGTPVIAFFSSEGALRRAVTGRHTYLNLPVRTLFDGMRGARLLLNPGDPVYSTEFSPRDVDRLLRGEDLQALDIHAVNYNLDEVDLRPPPEYPHAFVQVMRQLFAGLPQVWAAYLAQATYPDHLGDPRLVIGIAPGSALQAVTELLRHHPIEVEAAGGPGIDLIRMDASSPQTEYLARTKPFYTRGWMSRLRASLFGDG